MTFLFLLDIPGQFFFVGDIEITAACAGGVHGDGCGVGYCA